MNDIKEKSRMKAVKTLEAAQKVPKEAMHRIGEIEQYAQNEEQSAGDFAEEQIRESGQHTVNDVTGTAEHAMQSATKKFIKSRMHEGQEYGSGTETVHDTGEAEKASSFHVQATAERGDGEYAGRQTERVFQRQEIPAQERKKSFRLFQRNNGKQDDPQRTVKVKVPDLKQKRNTVKVAQKAAKTAQQAAKKSEQTVKTAKAAKEASVKSAQAAAKAAKGIWELVKRLFQWIAEKIEQLAALIAEGGWVAVVVILCIALVAILLLSAFGIFWSNESSDGMPMSEIIQSIDSEYRESIDQRIKEYSEADEYEEVITVYKGENNDGDSAVIYNWDDVLGVYAVLTTTDDSSATDVITVTDDTEERIRSIFYEMNHVSFETSVEVTQDTTEDETEEPVEHKTLTIYITQSAMDYREAADHYNMTDSQREILTELMSEEYNAYFAALVGVDIYGGTDLTSIVSNLPASGKGAEVVKAALTKLGCPYVWGAKGFSKFDCSGLSYWSINQVDEALGSKMYTNAAGQAKYCYEHNLIVGRDELQPGDLVFWQNKNCEGCHRWNEIHHVGIYIGDGKVIEASSSKGRVVIRGLWESRNYPILMFGRPYGNN